MHSPSGTSAHPVPVASLGSTNFAKHRYKSFDNAHGPRRRYIQRGSRRQPGGVEYERYGKREWEKEGGSAGNLAIRQAAPTTLRSAHSRTSRSLGRPNVSDDVADIANCKNYHHGTSPTVSAPYFLTRANSCASRPVLNSMLSRVI